MLRYIFIKSVRNSTSHKKTLCVFKKLSEFKNILSGTFIYEPILMKIDMNADNINIQIFHSIKYDLLKKKLKVI